MAENSYAVPIKQSLQFFSRTLSVFKEEDSGFAPDPGMFTVAQQVAHVAQTIDWFMAGGFSDQGFDLDFAAHHNAVRRHNSLQESLAWLVKAVDGAAATLATKTPEEMMAPGRHHRSHRRAHGPPPRRPGRLRPSAGLRPAHPLHRLDASARKAPPVGAFFFFAAGP
jgi:hypothetical protein